ncbi:complex I intermediate-associated protein 30-domain-containing protein [Amylocarpus encephaloides]|uniref:Complex I intermediate-associated protein 30-domain-containing protein n=1 Tax=Amylocarpus encephaloides TaxID=45428 RepID=A0A9P7YKF7_9HELO|nr:complex I intermediate-associated protein 30-domain-containing protein [Amylocarpus encephaloides]
MFLNEKYLFGGDEQWLQSGWTSSDDRVRGGYSISHLTCHANMAVFHGNLDIEALGGAGFASQRTVGNDRTWDLSGYDGLLLHIAEADGKKYTLAVKDEILPKSPNGREQSTMSWEYEFEPKKDGEKIHLTWGELNPTYRGREKKDAEPLDLKRVKRFSLMMRRYLLTFSSWGYSVKLDLESVLAGAMFRVLGCDHNRLAFCSDIHAGQVSALE